MSTDTYNSSILEYIYHNVISIERYETAGHKINFFFLVATWLLNILKW